MNIKYQIWTKYAMHKMVQVKNGKYECECECSRGRNELAKCQTGKLERSFLPHAPSDRGKIASFSHTSNFLHFFHLFPLQLQLHARPQLASPHCFPSLQYLQLLSYPRIIACSHRFRLRSPPRTPRSPLSLPVSPGFTPDSFGFLRGIMAIPPRIPTPPSETML